MRDEHRTEADRTVAELAKQNGTNTAFPNPMEKRSDGEIISWATPGISKREMFAAMAMQGLCANETWELNHVPKQTAIEAVEYADALLKELAK